MKLLHINASPRGDRSRTRTLAAEFLDALQTRCPDLEIEELDLFGATLPEVTGGAVDAKYLLMQGDDPNAEHQVRWNEIKRYANHFLAADLYLISAPMWNFSVPYKLKQYIVGPSHQKKGIFDVPSQYSGVHHNACCAEFSSIDSQNGQLAKLSTVVCSI